MEIFRRLHVAAAMGSGFCRSTGEWVPVYSIRKRIFDQDIRVRTSTESGLPQQNECGDRCRRSSSETRKEGRGLGNHEQYMRPAVVSTYGSP